MADEATTSEPAAKEEPQALRIGGFSDCFQPFFGYRRSAGSQRRDRFWGCGDVTQERAKIGTNHQNRSEGSFSVRWGSCWQLRDSGEQEGFKLSKVRLKVGAHAPTPLRIVLAIADLSEEISVDSREGRVNTDLDGNLDVISLDRQMLEGLPILGDDLVGALSRMLDGSVTLVVDGMETSDFSLPLSSIQEVKINRNPYAAEFSGQGKGRVEIVTKEGSSKYHGGFAFRLRDYRLDARNAFAVRRPPEQRRLFEGSLSGPAGKRKKTTFLVSAYREEADLQSVVYALTPSGLTRGNVPNPQRSTLVSTRVNRKVDKNNTMSFRYSFFDWSDRAAGIGGFNLPEVAMEWASRKHDIHYSLKTVLTPKLVNELSFQGVHAASSARSWRPDIRKIVVMDAFTGGGAQVQEGQTRDSLRLADVLSWSIGRHIVKAGISIPTLSRHESTDRSNFDGTFYFSSLEDYNVGRPFTFIQQEGDSHLAFWQKEIASFVQDDFRINPNLSMGFGVRYEWQNFLADQNNFAPRWSFAYSPRKSRSIVLRGGAGFSYQRTGEGPIRDSLRFDGYRLRKVVVSSPGYPDPFSGMGSLSTQPSSVVRLAADLRSPYTLQYSFGVEKELEKKTAFTANYVGLRGVKLFRSRDINAPFPPLYGQRPDPSIGILRQVESSASMSGHALNLGIQGKVTRFFDGMIQYTLARTYDDTAGTGSFPANNYDVSGEWSRANSDARHGVYIYGILNPGKLFKLGVVFSAYSGRPYSLITGRDDNRDGLASDRPPGIRRNSLEGSGSATLDVRWSKEFFFRRGKNEGPSTSISLDAFNVFNRVNFGTPIGNLSSPFFGLPVSAASARQMQVCLQFKF